MMWELDYLSGAGVLRSDVAIRVGELLTTADADRAADLMVQIESAIAPVSGGLSDDAPAVVTAVVAGLPQMSAETRVEALLLLTQLLGSVKATPTVVAADVGRLMEGAFPLLAAIIESGCEADIAQGIDLISMIAVQSRAAAERAHFYLTRLVERTSGAIKESAERELIEVEKSLG